MSVFPEVDVTSWLPAGEEPRGTKAKLWLFEDGAGEDRRWLWKAATFATARGGDAYRKGDDWAEKVAAELAKLLGLPAPRVELAKRDDSMGIISLDFTNDHTLSLGNELIAGVNVSYTATGRTRAEGYSLAAVLDALELVRPPEDDEDCHTSFGWFAGYVMLDAWIGNTDRHHENWGALVNGEGHQVLAPTFDHSSSLGFLLSDQEREDRLNSRDPAYDVEHWAGRAQTPFEGRPSTVVLAHDALALAPTPCSRKWLRRLAAVKSRSSEVFDQIPATRMTELSRAFATRVLDHNAATLLEGGGVE